METLFGPKLLRFQKGHNFFLGMDLKMGMAAIACERWPCNHRHSMGI
jgi:hypothetical protein